MEKEILVRRTGQSPTEVVVVLLDVLYFIHAVYIQR